MEYLRSTRPACRDRAFYSRPRRCPLRSKWTVASRRHRQAGRRSARPSAAAGAAAISIDEAVRLALEQNLGIQISARPADPGHGGRAGAVVWAPQSASTLSRKSQTQAVTTRFAGGAHQHQQRELRTGVGVDQMLPWGASYSVELEQLAHHDEQHVHDLQPADRVEPELPVHAAAAAQFLDRHHPPAGRAHQEGARDVGYPARLGHRPDDARGAATPTGTCRRDQQPQGAAAVAGARRSSRCATTGSGWRSAPWPRSTSSRRRPRSRATRRAVIVAEALIKRAKDDLRALILDPSAARFLGHDASSRRTRRRSRSRPSTSTAPCATRSTSAPTAVGEEQLERNDINIRYLRNQILPDINAQANYITRGVGGVQLSSLSPDDVLAAQPRSPGSRNRGFGSVLGDVFRTPTPTGRSASRSPIRSDRARRTPTWRGRGCSTSNRRRSCKNVQMQISTQVREAARNVQTNQKRVQSARASRELQEKSSKRRRRSRPPACRRASSCSRRSATWRRRARSSPGDRRLQQVVGRLRSDPARTAERSRSVHHRRRSAVDPIRQRRQRRQQHRQHRQTAVRARAGRAVSPPALRIADCGTSAAIRNLNRQSAIRNPQSAIRNARLPRVPKLSVTIITKNEAADIGDALTSVAWADEIVVVDSESTDETAAIARRQNARVVVRAWPGYVDQKNHAAALAQPRLDPLARCRRAGDAGARRRDPGVDGAPPESIEHAAFRIPRVTWHLGRWIRTTDWYPDHQLRLYDRRLARWTGRYVHEAGRARARSGDLRGELQHYAYRDISDHLETIDRYTTLRRAADAGIGQARDGCCRSPATRRSPSCATTSSAAGSAMACRA